MLLRIITAAACLLSTTSAIAMLAANDSGRAALRVFIDCGKACDMDYVRREIHFVDYVRDNRDADVHILVTRQENGAGQEFTLTYIGQSSFSGSEQRLRYSSSVTDTGHERRAGLVRMFKIGMAPYVAQTELGGGLQLTFVEPAHFAQESITDDSDPWNAWVFQSQFNGKASAEDRRDQAELKVALSAGRTTEDWSLWLGAGQHRRASNFTFDDGTTLAYRSRDDSAGASAVRAIGENWGAGLGVSQEQSTFLNLDKASRVAAAVEYNLYPYADSSERQMTFGYFLGQNSYDYEEVTILGALDETRADQGLYMDYDVTRPWGDMQIQMRAAQFLEDRDLYRVSVGASINYRILRGLSVGLWVESSLVRDQIYLPWSGSSDEDILLGRRALDTGATTRYGVKLRYSFGSIYNNVVNNRLEGSGFTQIF